jgi:hypothetical protein
MNRLLSGKKRLLMLISIIGIVSVVVWGISKKPDQMPPCEFIRTVKSGEVFTFEKGDILIRSNINYLPGTSEAPSGRKFGHAAIVVQRGEGKSIDEALSKAIVVEGIIYDQASRSFEFDSKKQVRKTTAKISFGNRFAGIRYRLRTKLTNEQKETMRQFLEYQLAKHRYDLFSTKDTELALSISKSMYNLLDGKKWNCTTLCWFAFMNATSLDIDSNKGLLVYPNDIIRCKYFDGDNGRIRF